MKTTFVRHETEDNLVLHGLLYEPDTKSDKVILHIHGMGGNFYENNFLDFMSKTFTDQGFAFLTINTRGHDLISDFVIKSEKEEYKRIGNFREKFEDCILDIRCWLDFLEKKAFKNIVLQGHSLGAVKVVYYLAKTNDQRVNKLVLASPPDMIALFEAEKTHPDLLETAKKMVEEGKGEEILPIKIWDWYYLSADTYLNFAQRNNEIDIFNIYDKQSVSLISKINIPILAFFGSKDDAIILPKLEAFEVLHSKANNCPQFDTKIIEGASHVYFGHEEETAKIVIDWIVK